MKRLLTSLAILLIVFVVFALVVSPLRSTPVEVGFLFFPIVQTSAEALAYVSFFIGLLLAGIITEVDAIALRKRYRAMLLEQRKRFETANQTDAPTAQTDANSVEERTPPQ
jgi:hypothetical protein